MGGWVVRVRQRAGGTSRGPPRSSFPENNNVSVLRVVVVVGIARILKLIALGTAAVVVIRAVTRVGKEVLAAPITVVPYSSSCWGGM